MRTCTLLALGLLAAAHAARSATVQVDVRVHFNADEVVNDGTGALDPTQDPVDQGVFESDNFCFPSQSAAARLAGGGTPDGVPDDAFFPADAFHPDVQLWWRNDDDGQNARRTSNVADVFTIDVPPGNYAELHLFATSGDGVSPITLTLLYDDLTTSPYFFTVPDWFDDPFPTADLYPLVDGRDRVQVGSGPGVPFAYEDRNDAAIFGFRAVVDPAKVLNGVKVDRAAATSVFDFFGLVAVDVVPPAGPDLYESPVAQGLLDPAHVVLRDVSSPLDHAPPAAPLLCYFVDDLAGFPALIRVAKSPAGLRFTF